MLLLHIIIITITTFSFLLLGLFIKTAKATKPGCVTQGVFFFYLLRFFWRDFEQKSIKSRLISIQPLEIMMDRWRSQVTAGLT